MEGYAGPPRETPEHHEPRVSASQAAGWTKRQLDKFGRTDVDLGWFDAAASTLLLVMGGMSVAGLLGVLVKLPLQFAVRLALPNLAVARALYSLTKMLNCCTTAGVIVGGIAGAAFKRRVMRIRWGQRRLGLLGLVAVCLVVIYAAGYTLSGSLSQVGELVLKGSPMENKILYCRNLQKEGLTQPDWCYEGPRHCKLLEKVGAPLPAYCSGLELGSDSAVAGRLEAFVTAILPLVRGIIWIALGLIFFLGYQIAQLVKRSEDEG